jgi:dTDP-4-dehydrorhamnose 3,5-epimerase
MRAIDNVLSGLILVELDIHDDLRGSFREVFRVDHLAAVPGLQGFRPVQQNISHNLRGTIRGMHAEPWDKFIHVAFGQVFAALVDMRPDSATFGQHATFTLGQKHALFVPRGFGNGFQALTEPAVYGYLVNAHWDPSARYPGVALDDPELAIAWPLPEDEWIVSDKDRSNPSFAEFRKQVSG